MGIRNEHQLRYPWILEFDLCGTQSVLIVNSLFQAPVLNDFRRYFKLTVNSVRIFSIQSSCQSQVLSDSCQLSINLSVINMDLVVFQFP
jgi:hypothetical protein